MTEPLLEAATRELGELRPMMRRNTQGDGEGEDETNVMDTSSEYSLDEEEVEIFGNVKDEKDPHGVRIGISNVGCWPLEGTVQYNDFQKWATDSDFDVLLLNELGKNWSQVKSDKKIENMVKNWWMNTYTNARWLKESDKEVTSERQYGGTAIISNDRVACTISASGGDEKDLGRWAWTTYRGRNNVNTTLISLYYPCKSSDVGSVEMQQLEKLAKDFPGERKQPFVEYRKDLKRLIKQKLDSNHQVIIGGDFNNSLRTQRDHLSKLLQTLGLREVILEKYGAENAPNTRNPGSEPIDGVWATGGIEILKGGYEKWNMFSDHRTLWVEIHEQVFLGRGLESLTKPKARRLQTNNPTIKKKFQELLDEKMDSMEILERALALDAAVELGANPRLEPDIAEAYEQLYLDRDNCNKFAEKRCRKIKGGGVPYSPAIAKIMGEVTVWKMILKRHRRKGAKGRPRIKLIKRAITRWKFDREWRQLTKEEVIECLRQAKEEFKAMKPKAQELRTTYLELLAEAYAAEDGKSKEKHFKNLLFLEHERNSWRRIKRATKSNRGGLCSKVERENADRTRTLITNEDELVAECINANEAKLQQSNNTPLREEPLRTYFGEDGDFEKWESIIEGELPIPDEWDIERGTRLVMDELTKGAGEDIDFSWDEEEYTASWDKMRENTVSAPGCHFGHFKAVEPGSAAAMVNSILAKIPIATGYSPKAWRKCVNSMIVKKVNDIRAAKLRLIALLDAQFNHNNKLCGKLLLQKGEEEDMIAPEQYGSRKKKSARIHALNKRLVLDIAIQQKKPMVLTANDAKSCYDRIILMVAYMVMRKYGVPKNVARSLLDSILRLEHKIRTVYGDSERTYGGDAWFRPPHGNGQGNGTGPSLWACISTIILDIMRKTGYGMEMKAVISYLTLLLVGFSFVDDTDLIQGGDDGKDALKKAQEGLNLWDELLRATGGAIEPTKTDWAMLDFTWKQGKWEFVPKDEGNKLRAKDCDGVAKVLTQLNYDEARETLGVWQSLDGQDETQTKKLIEKVEKWCSGMQLQHLQSADVARAIKSTITKTIEYGLVATSMNEGQCKRVIDPVVRRVMPKMKLARNLKRDVVHGTEESLGVGIPDVHVLQMIEKVQAILNHGGKSTHTGKLITIALENHLLEVGTSGQLLDTTRDGKDIAAMMEGVWFKQLVQSLGKYKIAIKTQHEELKLWRRNDEFLMDCFLRRRHYAGGISQKQLLSINRCRRYLNVLTLSDIADGDGERILPWVLECKKPQRICTISGSHYEWSPHGRPSSEDRRIWKEELLSVFCHGSPTGIMNNHLGPWTEEALASSVWRYNPDCDRIYHKHEEDNRWKYWGRVVSRTRTPNYVSEGWVRQDEIDEATSIPGIHLKSKYRCIHYGHFFTTIATVDPVYEDFKDELINHKDNGWGIADIELSASLDTIARTIMNGDGKFATDGSTKEGRSASGFLMFDDEDFDLFTGGNHVPGRESDQNSYRAELAGILGILLVLKSVCNKKNITHGSVEIACDNKTALTNAFEEGLAECTMPSYDILHRIRSEIKESPLTFVPRKVKGHQDKKIAYENLDMWAKANCRADWTANMFMNTHPDTIDRDFPHKVWTVTVDNTPIVSNVKHELYTHCTDIAVRKHWAKKNYFSEAHIPIVDWNVIKKASKRIKGKQRRWITKHFCHNSATGKVMKTRGERPDAKCPLCGETEDTDHVIQCMSDTTEDVFEAEYDSISDWLKKTTEPNVRRVILEFLNAVRENRDFEMHEEWPQDIVDLANDQLRLGTRATIHGFFSTSWARWHRDYFTEIGSKTDSITWVSTLIEKLWDMQYLIWCNRCTVAHSDEEAQKIMLSADQIDDELRNLWDEIPPKRMLNRSEQRAFEKPIAEVLKMKTRRKVRFLRRSKRILDSYKQAPTQNATPACMLNWLSTANPIIRHVYGTTSDENGTTNNNETTNNDNDTDHEQDNLENEQNDEIT